MKEFVIQYFDEEDNLRIAYVKAHYKEEAVEKFRKGNTKNETEVHKRRNVNKQDEASGSIREN